MPDYFTSVLLSKPVTQAVRDQAMAVIARAERALPWVGSLQGPAALMLNQGRWPLVANATDVTSDPTQQQQWRLFSEAYKPFTAQVLKGAMAEAKAEGDRLAANTALWETIYRVDLAIATTGMSEVGRLWDELKEKMVELKADRAATKVALDVVREAVADPKYAAALAPQKAQLAQLDAANAQTGAGAASALGPVSSISGVKEDLGLGGVSDMASKAMPWLTPAKLIAVGISAAVLVAVISSFSLWVSKQAQVKMQANQLAADTLARKDAIAKDLLEKKVITVAEYNNQLKQNADDVATVRRANEGEGFGSNLGKYIGYGAVIAGIGLAIYLILKGRRGGSTPPG